MDSHAAGNFGEYAGIVLLAVLTIAWIVVRCLRGRGVNPETIGTVERVQPILPGVRLAVVRLSTERLTLVITASGVEILVREVLARE